MDFESKVIRGLDGNYNRHEKRYQEELRLKPMKYGFFSISRSSPSACGCNFCNKEIFGASVVIDGVPFHESCFVQKCNEKNK